MNTKFNIGDVVFIKRIAYRHIHPIGPPSKSIEKVEWTSEQIKEPFFAIITGVVRKQIGQLYTSDDGERSSVAMVCKKTIMLYEYKRGMMNNPGYAHEKDIELESANMAAEIFHFPKLYQHITDGDREYRSNIVEDAARDVKGRFV